MKTALVLSLLAIFVISACGYTVDRPYRQGPSNRNGGPPSSRPSKPSQKLSSDDDLSAILSSLLSSTTYNTTVVVEVTSENSTAVDSSEDASTEDTTDDDESASDDSDSDESDSDESSEDSTASTSSSDSSTDSSTVDSFVQDLLTAHNEYRTLHGVANLTLNSTLSAYALEWAEYLAENSLLQHRTDAVYGENIYWSSATTTAQAAADAWYSEISDYTDYTTEPDMTTFTSGHYTQMVWKSSEQLGCGSVTASGGGFFVVCNYSPAGNYIGEFVANVLQPSS